MGKQYINGDAENVENYKEKRSQLGQSVTNKLKRGGVI